MKLEKKEMLHLYLKCKNVKAGHKMRCPSCGSEITKTSYQHTFCDKKCKDYYWNNIDPRKNNRKHPRSHYRKYNVGEKSYISRFGDSIAAAHGYPSLEAYQDAIDMDDPSWEGGGGVICEPCKFCGMAYEYCECDH